MEENLLEVEHLYKSFPIQKGFFRRTKGYVHALLDASFSLKTGEVLGVVGEYWIRENNTWQNNFTAD